MQRVRKHAVLSRPARRGRHESLVAAIGTGDVWGCIGRGWPLLAGRRTVAAAGRGHSVGHAGGLDWLVRNRVWRCGWKAVARRHCIGAFLIVGVLGGLTTYSSLMLEVLLLSRGPRSPSALAYTGTTLVLGLLLVAGYRVAAGIRAPL